MTGRQEESNDSASRKFHQGCDGSGRSVRVGDDLGAFDRTPMFELNEINWKIVRGEDSEMPLPVRRYDLSAQYPPARR